MSEYQLADHLGRFHWEILELSSVEFIYWMEYLALMERCREYKRRNRCSLSAALDFERHALELHLQIEARKRR